MNVTRAAADATDRASYNRAELRMRQGCVRDSGPAEREIPGVPQCLRGCPLRSMRASGRAAALWTGDRHRSDLLSGKVPEYPNGPCAHPMDIHIPGGNGRRLIPLEKPAYIPPYGPDPEECFIWRRQDGASAPTGRSCHPAGPGHLHGHGRIPLDCWRPWRTSTAAPWESVPA